MSMMPGNELPNTQSYKGLSFFSYLRSELRRGYLLENDEERFAARREKVYTFFKIPRELEKFLAYGFYQCMDSFLFVLTFLPIRFMFAVLSLLTRPFKRYFGFRNSTTHILKPAEIIDLLKGILLIICCYFISYIDTSVCYHIIKTQSTIKLYLFFNMLEIADRLMSAFGQDTLDALFWTATEPRDRKREHFGLIFHVIVASIYVAVHSVIVLLQALCLNVAINSDNKGLLTIVISNNFIELKGAVFKKFDRNNLLQISCSDIRERFHLGVLLFVVVIQTMKEYSWKEQRLWILLPDCFLVLGSEVLIDWLKHAFITRFNNIGVEAYRDYTILLASDLIMCKQKYAYSDHSDLVARRMGFIPLPLGVVIFRILSQSLRVTNAVGVLIFVVGYLCLLTFRVLNGIVILGKACDLIKKADQQPVRSREPSGNREKPFDKLISNGTSIRVPNVRESSPLVSRKFERVPTPEVPHPTTVDNNKDTESTAKLSRSTSTDNIVYHRELIENVSWKERVVGKDISSGLSNLSSSSEILDNTSSCSSPTIIESLCTDSKEDLDDNPLDTLTFLGESESGLMANSMVSLDSVGLTQNVNNVTVDDPSNSLVVPENCSDFDKYKEDRKKLGHHLNFSFDRLRENSPNKNYTQQNIESSLLSSPLFTSTQSCPCLAELLTNSSPDNDHGGDSESSSIDCIDSSIDDIEEMERTLVGDKSEIENHSENEINSNFEINNKNNDESI